MMKALSSALVFMAVCVCGLAGAAERPRVLGLPLGEKLGAPVMQCESGERQRAPSLLCWAGKPSLDGGAQTGTVEVRTGESLPVWAAPATIAARVEPDHTLRELTLETMGQGSYRVIKDALSARFGLPSRQSPLSATAPSAAWHTTGLTVTLTCAARCKVGYRAYTAWSPPGDAVIAALAPSPDHRWRLRVRDPAHRIRIAATVRFTTDAAQESCMAGNWKRLVVETIELRDEPFFPLAQALAYTIENGELVAGRTGICDGYLFLVGKPGKQSIAGSFRATGLGSSEKLGDFDLTIVP